MEYIDDLFAKVCSLQPEHSYRHCTNHLTIQNVQIDLPFQR